MATPASRLVCFNDARVRGSGHICIAAKPVELDPDKYDFARIFFHRLPNQWRYEDLPWRVSAVCSFGAPPAWWVLAESGEIACYSVQGNSREKIDDVEKYGALNQLRAIGGTLYACGLQGQVYRRDYGGWNHIDQGILDPIPAVEALHLNDIDGTSGQDIFAVAYSGRILHYDGSSWSDLPSPTNLHLERVLCVAPGLTYVCGDKGTFLKITPAGIENHSVEAEDFWGLCAFQGKVYLATLEGLYVFDGNIVEELDTGLDPPIGGYRLDASDDQLWSVGIQDIAYFDGTSWTRVIHPDNV